MKWTLYKIYKIIFKQFLSFEQNNKVGKRVDSGFNDSGCII